MTVLDWLKIFVVYLCLSHVAMNDKMICE